MSQITTGIRSLLSNPIIYELFQKLMGSHKARIRFVDEFINPYSTENILDIGCGPAGILAYLPETNYYGFDISQSYITKAQNIHGDKGHFYAKHITTDDLKTLPKFDLVLVSGVLHHVDDETAIQIIKIAYEALKHRGRLLTIDPVFSPDQNPIAKYLISKDRGQNVRTAKGYKTLVDKVFTQKQVNTRHKTWIPYTHCIMECQKT